MLPMGHLSIAYLISQIAKLKKKVLKREEILFILFCGVIFDLDSFLPAFLGFPAWLNHHFFFSHTPLFGLFYLFIFYILFKKKFSSLTFFLAGLAMVSHLVLDDLAFLLSLFGWELQEGIRQQIFWWYPFDARRNTEFQRSASLYGNAPPPSPGIVDYYLFEARNIFIIENFLTLIALIIFTKNRLKDS